MLPTREDAERLAEAIRGQGLLEVLKALQNFELKVEDIASLDTDVAMVIATATMFIAGDRGTSNRELYDNLIGQEEENELNHRVDQARQEYDMKRRYFARWSELL